MRKYAYILLSTFISCICNAELAQIEDMEMENFSIKAESALILKDIEEVDDETLTVKDHSEPVLTYFQNQMMAADVVEIRDTGHSFNMAPIQIQIN